MRPSIVYCDTCGAANQSHARFCIACGHAMPVPSSFLPAAQTRSNSSSSSSTGLLPVHSLLKQRYLILSCLGKGRMGEVYKAADTQLGDRLVAVKGMNQKGLALQELAEATMAFKREAHMLASLPHHPNLPSIYDHFGEGGRWYLVMDFIAGETLEHYLPRAGGMLLVEDVLDIGIQLCTVLNYLHSQQPPIIFRDLKPANVMRTANGQLYLIDFGIARHFKPGQAKDTIAYGSVGYAAPEQYGKAQTTQQSDIYSLGAMLHHLLSGNDPSQSPFVFAPLPTTNVPAELAMLIMRMVQMLADHRPASMTVVKQELQRLAALPTVVLPPIRPPKELPCLNTLTDHASGVCSVAFSPDGQTLASGSNDGTIKLWNVSEGACLRTLTDHTELVRSMTFSPDGQTLASGSNDQTIKI